MSIILALVYAYLIFSIIWSLYKAGKYSTGWRETKQYSDNVMVAGNVFGALVVFAIIIVIYFGL